MRKRSRYKNGDYIYLHTGCNSCTPSRINGVLCHESGCPDAWKDKRLICEECLGGFFSPRPDKVPVCHRHRR